MSDPLEEWHRAALAETMRPCRELPRPGRRMVPEQQRDRLPCPSCRKEYSASYMPKHFRSAHGSAVGA